MSAADARLALPLAGLLLSGACTGARVAERGLAPELAWPAGEARVRLERVFDLRRGSALSAGLIGLARHTPLFERPFGVAWSGDDLIVADPGARRLARIAGDGRVTWSQPDGAPLGVAACAAGIVASDPGAGRLMLFDGALRTARVLAEGLARPTGVACLDERVYVAETGRHRVLVLQADGSRVGLGARGEAPAQFNFPTALAAARGTLYVGDTLNFRVQVLDAASGAYRGAFGRLGDGPGDMPRLKGLALDARGDLWVSDAHLDRVSLYAPDGSLLLALGGRGSDPGRFSFPSGIAAHVDGRVAVADSLNRRVQVFRLLPQAGRRTP